MKPLSAPVFQWRALVSVVALISFAVLGTSGVVLRMAPPGRIANWGNWSFLGLRKYDWVALHLWFALLFASAAILHLGFNWRPLLGYFKSLRSRQWGFRLEWLAAAAFCAAVFVAVCGRLPPFPALLALTRNFGQIREQPGGWGPRGGAANCQGAVPSKSNLGVDELRSGAGGGRGGGFGRQTLAEFCAATGVDFATAQDRLKAGGIQAEPQQILWEISDLNGFQSPSELLRIVRGEGKVIGSPDVGKQK